MLIRHYVPGPPLSNFVGLLWLSEGAPPSHAKERLLPDGSMELVINLRDDKIRIYDRLNTDEFQSFRGAVISGPHSDFFVIDTADQDAVMGAHFKPGGAFPFFKLPASELHGEHVSLDTLWGRAAADLRDRLLEASTPATKFRILEQTLLAQIAKPLARHPAVEFALNKRPQRVSEITGQIGLSQRRFIQVFNEQVGLTPKVFYRVQRFQQVLRLVGNGRVDWLEIALSCGYFDQAHFIHDFRAFSGLNPTTWHSLRTEHFNHVPILD